MAGKYKGPIIEDPTCYKRTGIPCGNPQRYQSRGVIRMAPDGSSRGGYLNQAIDVPVEDIETEGDRQLQKLLDKQLATNITLQQHLSQKKSFASGSVFEKLETSGSHSLSQYQSLSEQYGEVEQLKQLGLTQQEIHIKLASQNGPGPAKRGKYSTDPAVHQIQLDAINKKIQEKMEALSKADTFGGARYMSRHEMDIEKAISHDSNKAKVLACLMTNEKGGSSTNSDPNDPINQLDSIWQEVLEKERAKNKDYSRDRETSRVICSSCLSEYYREAEGTAGPVTKNNEFGLCKECLKSENSEKTDGEVQEDVPSMNSNSNLQNRCQEREKKSPDIIQSVICDKKCDDKSEKSTSGVRALEGHVASISRELIERNRLSVDEIKEIPRFQHYTAGEPSPTLFLKNLSPKVTEEDLVAMFLRYEKADGPKIVFRLLTGRMKGQAFVTFDSEDSASKALQLLNGYQLKGKPVIIQYGKKKLKM